MQGNIGLSELCIIAAVALIALPGMALWIWALVDCATKEADTGNTKIVWIIVIVIGHFIGALIYIFARRPQRKRELGR
jgi:hypothetical protein